MAWSGKQGAGSLQGCALAAWPPPLASCPSLMTYCLVAGCGIMWYSLVLVLFFFSLLFFCPLPPFWLREPKEVGVGWKSLPLDLLTLSFSKEAPIHKFIVPLSCLALQPPSLSQSEQTGT